MLNLKAERKLLITTTACTLLLITATACTGINDEATALRLLFSRSVGNDESGDAEMSSGGEETELNFDFHGVLPCSCLREKRRENIDLLQRRGRRWSCIQR